MLRSGAGCSVCLHVHILKLSPLPLLLAPEQHEQAGQHHNGEEAVEEDVEVVEPLNALEVHHLQGLTQQGHRQRIWSFAIGGKDMVLYDKSLALVMVGYDSDLSWGLTHKMWTLTPLPCYIPVQVIFPKLIAPTQWCVQAVHPSFQPTYGTY